MLSLRTYYSCSKDPSLLCDRNNNCLECLELENKINEKWIKYNLPTNSEPIYNIVKTNK